jgi:hypothetical protein
MPDHNPLQIGATKMLLLVCMKSVYEDCCCFGTALLFPQRFAVNYALTTGNTTTADTGIVLWRLWDEVVY